jgi:MATE family multidrug resistance protein
MNQYHRVWALAWPIIVSNLSVPLVGAVDTAVVGHLPDPRQLGAVALGSVMFSFVFWGFGFLRMGTTGLVAQARGAGDLAEARAVLLRALLLALFLGLVLIAVQRPISSLAFAFTEGEEALEALAGEYFHTRIWGAPATLASYAVMGTLIALERTRSALLLQLLLNGTNVLLDLLFVPLLGWGVKGVAGASVIAEMLAAAVGLALLLRQVPHGDGPPARLLDRARLQAMLSINLNIFLRTLCLVAAFFQFTALGTRMGPVLLAANAVLMHFQHFLAFGLDGFAHATEALVGRAHGARDGPAFRQVVRAATVWALLVAVCYSLIYALAGPWLIGVLTNIEVVRESALEYLPWVLLSPLLSVWSFQLDGVYIGTTRTVEMRNAMLVSLAVFLLSTWLLLPALGNHGLWLSLMIFMIARAVTLGVLYPRLLRHFD